MAKEVSVRRLRVDYDISEKHGMAELILRDEMNEALVITGTFEELSDLGFLISRITHKHKVLAEEGVIGGA